MKYSSFVFVLILVSVAGCASSRDLRTLRAQVDELRTQQQGMAAQIDRMETSVLSQSSATGQQVVDVKYSLEDLRLRMEQIDAQLADLNQRVAQPGAVGASPRVTRPGVEVAPIPQVQAQDAENVSLAAPAGELYQQAFEALRREDYPAAIEGYRAYLALAGDSPEAGSAAYWIAESFYAQNQGDSALVHFQAVVDRYADSDKVPAALYKIGNIYEERGDKKSAFPYYRRLKEEFPQSLEYQQLRRKLGE
jgi:tol-pal system protein YbgF